MLDLVSRLLRSLADRRGVTAAEYAILAVGVVTVVGVAATAFKQPLVDAFTNVGTHIATQQASVSAR